MISKMFVSHARAEIDANLALIRACNSIMDAYESAQSVSACMYNPVYECAYHTWQDSKRCVSWLRRYVFDE